MIPKIVHYCWFGPKEMPENEKKYIENWKERLPDYKFILWNEDNFDVKIIPYVSEAYTNKKYAFVADYVRLFALNTYGGIYLDTDVELLSGFDSFLNDFSFVGFENRTMVGTGIIGTEPRNPIFLKMIDYYNKNHFIDDSGIMDMTTNVKILNNLLVQEGLISSNRAQVVGEVHIYDRNVFCPKKISDDSFAITETTVAIHHFNASWLTDREKKRGTSLFWRNICRPVLRSFSAALSRVIGEKKTKKIEARFRNLIR